MRLILQYLAWPCSPIGAAWKVGYSTIRHCALPLRYRRALAPIAGSSRTQGVEIS
jgi:hypothetical protein